MKFSCEKQILGEAINNVLPAVSSKSTIIALEGILMDCKNNQLSLTGYNLELGITKTIPVTGIEEGSIILNASLLSGIINKMPNGTVELASDEKLLTVINCDVVEFHRDDNGISLSSYEGLWEPYPVEYKKGLPKMNEADELQLCGQAICLEEMLLCKISCGSLFYGENRRRKMVEFTEELREKVINMAKEMHDLWEKGYTPRVKPQKGCNACSLKEICVPRLRRVKSVSAYIEKSLAEE